MAAWQARAGDGHLGNQTPARDEGRASGWFGGGPFM